MQYLLTETEYTELSRRDTPAATAVKVAALEAARKMILEAHKVKCVHESGGIFLCDSCPLFKLFWDNYVTLNAICTLEKEYSK